MIKLLTSYRKETSGSIATTSAAAITCLLMGIAVALDMNSMVSKRSYLQNIADSAVLAAVISGETDQSEMQAVAEAVVATSHYPNANVQITLTNDSTAKIQVSDSQKMLLMGMFGEKSKAISAESEAPLKGNSKLNLALVLDSTQSMSGSRISALKTASGNLLTKLQTYNNSEDNVKVSFVPFADYVRISTSNLGQTWLEVAPDHEATYQTINWEASTNCRVEGSGETAHTVCDNYVYNDHTEMQSWVGCMGSRRDGFHIVPEFNGRRLQGFAGHANCYYGYSQVEPLTADISSVKDNIQSLSLAGDTYLPAGLIWGWRTLDPSLPFTETVDDSDDTKNILLLMTDGSNTTSMNGERDGFNGFYHWQSGADVSEQTAKANAVSRELCTGIKNDGIQIITIAFEVDDTSTKSLLKTCASSDSDFYDASSADELLAAFQDIGSGMNVVRILR